jgi:hypothetical protein
MTSPPTFKNRQLVSFIVVAAPSVACSVVDVVC